MRPGRRIAFDFGDVRIGVAITDSSGILASPLDLIENTADKLRSDLVELFERYDPIYTAIGFPLHLSGNESAKSESVRQFAALISEITSKPIYLIDERMTTVSASRVLRDAGVNSKSAKNEIDSMAATGILESALNQERIQGAPIKCFEQ